MLSLPIEFTSGLIASQIPIRTWFALSPSSYRVQVKSFLAFTDIKWLFSKQTKTTSEKLRNRNFAWEALTFKSREMNYVSIFFLIHTWAISRLYIRSTACVWKLIIEWGIKHNCHNHKCGGLPENSQIKHVQIEKSSTYAFHATNPIHFRRAH